MSFKQSEQAMKQHEATGEIVPSAQRHNEYFSKEMWIITVVSAEKHVNCRRVLQELWMLWEHGWM
jgi:hypothetical protein